MPPVLSQIVDIIAKSKIVSKICQVITPITNAAQQINNSFNQSNTVKILTKKLGLTKNNIISMPTYALKTEPADNKDKALEDNFNQMMTYFQNLEEKNRD